MTKKRIIVDILLFLSILYLPFWFSVLLAFVAALYFKSFYELVIALLVIDLLYGGYGNNFLMTISGVILFALVSFLKKRLSFYS